MRDVEMLAKFLDPKNDVAFKKIFGTEKNKDILIHFLNDILIFKANKPIVNIRFLKTIQDPEIAAKKTSIVDIMCLDELNNQYIVEMQVADSDDFIKRAQYYAAKAYSSQLTISQPYHNLTEIIFLAITNFTMFPNKKASKSDHVILDKYSHENDLKDFSFTFLELTKFNKTKDQLNTILDKWSYFFKHAKDTKEQDLPEIIGSDNIIERAYEELNKFSWSEQELLAYEQVIKREKDYQSILQTALSKQHAKGKTEGILEGTIKIAKKLLNKGMSLNNIADITELSINQLKTIIIN